MEELDSVLCPGNRAKDVDGDNFQWTGRREQRQLVLVFQHALHFGTSSTVVYRFVDVAGHVRYVVLQPYLVVHSSFMRFPG